MGIEETVGNTVVYEGIVAEGIANLIGNLNLIHFNIRSINKNFNELLIYLQQVGLHNISFIILSECWNTKVVSNDYFIPDFTLYNNQSKLNQNDGCIIYVRETLGAAVSVVPITKTSLLRAIIKYNNIDIGLTASYRPHPVDVPHYIEDLDNYFANLDRQTIEIFMGDTNIDLLKTRDANVLRYTCTLAHHGLFSYIDRPTRVTANTESAIDHIFAGLNGSTNLQKHTKFSSFIFRTSLTDHDAVVFSISFNTYINNVTTPHDNVILKRVIDYKKLSEMLSREKWLVVYRSHDVEEAYNKFYDLLQHNLHVCTYLRKTSNNTYMIKPWMTKAVLNSIRYRDKLRKQLNKTYTEELKVLYTKYRNKLNKIIKHTRDVYYRDKINDASNNYKKFGLYSKKPLTWSLRKTVFRTLKLGTKMINY